MFKFTEEQEKNLMEQAKRCLEQTEEGRSTREIMAQIYVDGLDDKTLAQGEVMADAILESVNKFDCDFAAAKDDLDVWLDKILSRMTADMTPVQRCTFWLKLAAAVNGVSAKESLELDESEQQRILAEVENITVSEEEATPELEAQLYAGVKAVLENSSVMLSVLVSQQEAFRELESGDDAAAVLLDLGSREIDFRAVVSMMAYVNVKNGTFDNIPVDMKAEQITTMVCAEVEQLRILDAVSKGKMSMEVASMLLEILGLICIVVLAMELVKIFAIITVAMPMGLLTLPISLLLGLTLSHFLDVSIEEWRKASDSVVNAMTVPIKAIGLTLDKLVDYVRETATPTLHSHIKTAWEWIKQLVGRLTGKQVEPMVETEESAVVEEENIPRARKAIHLPG